MSSLALCIEHAPEKRAKPVKLGSKENEQPSVLDKVRSHREESALSATTRMVEALLWNTAILISLSDEQDIASISA